MLREHRGIGGSVALVVTAIGAGAEHPDRCARGFCRGKAASVLRVSRAGPLGRRNAATQRVLQETEATAKALQIDLRAFEARQPRDFERVFAAMAEQRVDDVVIHEDTTLTANANALAVFAAARQLPSSGFPELVRLGGLLAYGINFPDTDYRAAAFVDRILKGAKPGAQGSEAR
jgi:putative ABC transport system substrate-binding protein